MNQYYLTELSPEERRNVERAMRDAVQGKGSARVPKICKTPHVCPLRDAPVFQSVPSICYFQCGHQSETKPLT